MRLERWSWCTLPVSWLPISGTCLATALRALVRNDGLTEAIRPRIETRTSSSGNRETKAEYAKLEARAPPLSSPYFFTTPTTNAVGVYRCCTASIRRIARSTRFIAPASLVPAIALPASEAVKLTGAAAHCWTAHRHRTYRLAGRAGSEGGVFLGRVLVGVVALGHGRGEPGPRAVQPLAAHPREPFAAFAQFQRLLQGQAARLKALDDRRQLVPGLLIRKRLLGDRVSAAPRDRAPRAACHDLNPLRHRPCLLSRYPTRAR